MKFKKKLAESEEGSIGKECWEQTKKKENKTELEETRRKFFEKRGWSRPEVERRVEEGEEIWREMTERNRHRKTRKQDTNRRIKICKRGKKNNKNR